MDGITTVCERVKPRTSESVCFRAEPGPLYGVAPHEGPGSSASAEALADASPGVAIALKNML